MDVRNSGGGHRVRLMMAEAECGASGRQREGRSGGVGGGGGGRGAWRWDTMPPPVGVISVVPAEAWLTVSPSHGDVVIQHERESVGLGS